MISATKVEMTQFFRARRRLREFQDDCATQNRCLAAFATEVETAQHSRSRRNGATFATKVEITRHTSRLRKKSSRGFRDPGGDGATFQIKSR